MLGQRSNRTARALRRSLATGVALVIVSCGGRAEVPSTATAAPPSSGPVGSTAATPSSTEPKGNPAGVGSLFYVVGSAGLAGPSVLYTGTVTFTVTNNDDRSHRLVFVRLGETRSVPSIVGQVRRLGSAWPPRSADVLDEAVLPDARLTKTMKVPALRPGSYALVDMGTDPASGNPYAYSDLFVVAIEVVDLPG